MSKTRQEVLDESKRKGFVAGAAAVATVALGATIGLPVAAVATNNAPKTRGRPFQKGNPGRPLGARHKATLAAEALLDGEARRR